MNKEEAFCPNCEWTGDATGITSCPVCNASLSNLENFDEDEESKGKYPSEILDTVEENKNNSDQ